MDSPLDGPPPVVVLPTSPKRAVANEWALVLASQGLKSRVERTPAGFTLLVDPSDAIRAAQILATWREENVPRQALAELENPIGGQPLHYVVAFAASLLLLSFHVYLERSEVAPLYYRVGRASAAQIMHGELWRVLTALTLHSNFVHALGNTLFGGFLLASLSGRVGAGFALAGAVLTGGLGNLVNAIQRQPDHNSVGASTAVFGVVGLLCGVEVWRRKQSLPWRTTWIPLGAGVGLLAMLGTGSARVDLGAHVFGLLAGMAVGLAVAPLFNPRPPGVAKQIVVGLASLLLILGCWALALRPAPF